MITKLQNIISTLFVLIPIFIFGQTINLGILTSFEGYTGDGAITNSGLSWTGDTGSNNGLMSGFVSPSFNDNTYNADSVTAQCRFDLFRLYIQLIDLYVDFPATHAPAFGGGETITPGVYSIPGAGSIVGAITLDGGGNTDAFFIIKFNGAMTVGAGSVVTLSGGTQSCNVFWIAEGAISVAASTDLKGTLFAHIGAIGLGAEAVLEGRMLTTDGAITTGSDAVVSLPPCTSSIQMFCEANCTAAPAVDVLGSVSNFAFFASYGAVSNTGTSGIDGDIGTNGGGVISGFASSIHVGEKYSVDATTAQAKIDLDAAYIALMALPNTVTAHASAFGIGETLTPGVYFIAGAGSLEGALTLDGGGDPDAVFVFKFGGAFSVSAQSKVILYNGTRRCNVFWIGGAGVATGAVNIGAGAIIKGTIISHGGACGAGVGAFLAGRMLSTAGAIVFSTGVNYNNPDCVTSEFLREAPLPIELLSFTAHAKEGHVQLNWATASETNNDYFNIERSDDAINFTSINSLGGAGNSSQIINYSEEDNKPLEGTSYYRLKQTDYDGKYSYSNIEAVLFNNINDFIFNVYPNPNDGDLFNLQITKNNNSEVLVVVYDMLINEIYSKVMISGKNASEVLAIYPSQKLNPGIYLITASSGDKIYKKRLIVK